MSTQLPSERELQLLKILWEREGGTVRALCEQMAQQGHTLAYTTVLTVMQTMEQKGLVRHTAAGKTYTYHAVVQRDTTFKSLARGFLESVFDGAVDQYLMHALDHRQLSADEVRQLEATVAKAKQQSRKS